MLKGIFKEGDYIYVSLVRRAINQWPVTLRFSYPRGSGQANIDREFASPEAAKELIDGLLQHSRVRFSKSVQHILNLGSDDWDPGSKI